MMMLPDHAGIVARSHKPVYSVAHLGWVCDRCYVYLPGGDRDGMMPPPTPTEDQCPEWRLALHIDLYSVHAFHGYDGGEPRRQFEGQEAIDYATTGPGGQKGLPYWNGYYLQTALHDDSQCEDHRPEKWAGSDLVRKPVKRPLAEGEQW